MVRYSAFVLKDDDHNKVVEKASKLLEDGLLNQAGWEILSHHCTINMGNLDADLRNYKGYEYDLDITHIGINERVIAFKVAKNTQSGKLSKNKTPHITVAVNRMAGAKPVESNQIENWIELDAPFTVKGILTEVK